MSKFITVFAWNSVTPKGDVKHEALVQKPASDAGLLNIRVGLKQYNKV